MDILVVGGSGAIGGALLHRLAKCFPNAHLHATYHSTQPHVEITSRVDWHQLDVRDESQIQQLSQTLDSMDWVVNASGVLSASLGAPEKSIRHVNQRHISELIELNCTPTLLLAKYFEPLLAKSSDPRLFVLSARVGSIEDNRKGGWYSYRLSKAALNMAIKTLSIEWQRTIKGAVVMALHPGTTSSNLTAPFMKWIPPHQLQTPTDTATMLVSIMQKATTQDSGRFVDYSGQDIPW